MHLRALILERYGEFTDLEMSFGPALTVVAGSNESGKSTALDALTDLLWGIPAKTPRASTFARPKLRIRAELETPDGIVAVVRTSAGLLGADGAAMPAPPWNPDGRLDAAWWVRRLGLNHDRLVSGGGEVFAGQGDIGEVIFAASEGAGVRELRRQLAERAAGIFKPHRNATAVDLRVAYRQYREIAERLEHERTKSAEIEVARHRAEQCRSDRAHAGEAAVAAARHQAQAEEDVRAITHVLGLVTARREQAAITAEGPRLSPDELERLDATQAAASSGRDRLLVIDGALADANNQDAALSIDDALLEDATEVEQLSSGHQAVAEALQKAADEDAPPAAEAEAEIRTLLAAIGAESSGELAAGIDAVMVRADLAATADQLSADHGVETERARVARAAMAEPLSWLLSAGIDGTPVKPIDSPRVDDLLAGLQRAQAHRESARRAADDALARRGETIRSTPAGVSPMTVSAEDVRRSRDDRDAAWQAVRRDWVAAVDVSPDERLARADRLDESLRQSDDVADLAATETARQATAWATEAAHAAALVAVAADVESTEREAAQADVNAQRAHDAWAAAWADIGIAPPPHPTVGSLAAAKANEIVALSRTAGEADEAAAALIGSWQARAVSLGLPVGADPVSWLARADRLRQIESLRDQWQRSSTRVGTAERRWTEHRAAVRRLAARHGVAIAPDASPADVGRHLADVARRLAEARVQQAKREERARAVAAMEHERSQLLVSIAAVDQCRTDLAAAHDVPPGPELDELVERARRATDPAARLDRFSTAARAAIDPGTSLEDIVVRLDEQDPASVDALLAQATADHAAAAGHADATISALAEAEADLRLLTGRTGAAERLAELAATQERLRELAHEWLELAIQIDLLDEVIAGYAGSSGAALLERAGQILASLTDGRYVALQSEVNGESRSVQVVRADDDRYVPEQLSQGTSVQAFLALRLAAVCELHRARVAAGAPPLPLVLDDVLMTFDDDRTTRALDVLSDLAPGLQVIVLTHHAHVLRAARLLPGVAVCELPSPGLSG